MADLLQVGLLTANGGVKQGIKSYGMLAVQHCVSTKSTEACTVIR